MTEPSLPARGAHPRDAVSAGVRLLGADAMVDACLALVADAADVRIPLELLAGTPDFAEHWRPVWALRAFLYVWQERATPTVVAMLGADAWRAREMAAKVCAARLIDDALPALEQLEGDAVDRVRLAAERALRRIAAAPDAS